VRKKLVLIVLSIMLLIGVVAPRGASADQDARVKALMQRMTPEEKIGQLFVVTFRGNDVSQGSDIAKLIVKVLSNMQDEPVKKEVREDVEGITSRFTVPGLDT